MNASGAQLRNPSITDTVNNCINELIFVLRRANYIVASRGPVVSAAARPRGGSPTVQRDEEDEAVNCLVARDDLDGG